MLQGKTIVITGAASGIGRASAQLAAAQGAHIIAADIASPPADTPGQYLPLDVADTASIDRFIAQLPGGIHGLVNCAGLPPTRPAAQVLKVNLIGPKQLTYRMVDKLADGASIVHLASLAGLGWVEPGAQAAIAASADLMFEGVEAFCQQHQIEGGRSYSFSKEALIVWTLQNAWAWRERGIRMNAISPGPVDTAFLTDCIELLGKRAEDDLRIVGRAGTVEEIAPVVCFLLSNGASWICGANLPVDGGMFAHVLRQRHGFAA